MVDMPTPPELQPRLTQDAPRLAPPPFGQHPLEALGAIRKHFSPYLDPHALLDWLDEFTNRWASTAVIALSLHLLLIFALSSELAMPDPAIVEPEAVQVEIVTFEPASPAAPAPEPEPEVVIPAPVAPAPRPAPPPPPPPEPVPAPPPPLQEPTPEPEPAPPPPPPPDILVQEQPSELPPEPVFEPVFEPVPEPVMEPVPDPIVEPEPTIEFFEPEPLPEPVVVTEPIPVPEPLPEPVTEVFEPQPFPEPLPEPEPEPLPIPIPDEPIVIEAPIEIAPLELPAEPVVVETPAPPAPEPELPEEPSPAPAPEPIITSPVILASPDAPTTAQELDRAVTEDQAAPLSDLITGRPSLPAQGLPARDPRIAGPQRGGGNIEGGTRRASPGAGGWSLAPSTSPGAGFEGLVLDTRCRELSRTHEDCPEYVRGPQGRDAGGFETFTQGRHGGTGNGGGISGTTRAPSLGSGAENIWKPGGGTIGDNSFNAGGPSTNVFDDTSFNREFRSQPVQVQTPGLRVRDLFATPGENGLGGNPDLLPPDDGADDDDWALDIITGD